MWRRLQPNERAKINESQPQFSINDALVLPAETSESSLFTKAFLLLPVEELLL